MQAGSTTHLHSARSDVFLLKLQMMEQVKGIGPLSAVWRTAVLAIILYLHKYVGISLCSFFNTLNA